MEQQLELADSAVAPELLDLEVLSALGRLLRAGHVTPRRAAGAVDDLGDLRVVRWPHVELARRIWELRAHMTPYDAAYVALAELLGAELVTTDRRIARARGHRARIRAFGG